MIRGLDIFCGAGGSSAGARAAGITMVGAVDMCDVATATYKANFPQAHVLTGRLEDVSVSSLKRRIGKIDILLSSPECTNHTCAKGSAPRSEESRATAMHVVEYAKAFKPRWLVLENVVHMRPWSRYDELKHELRKIGYNLKELILDSSEFGVPQTRKRLFLVGDRACEPGELAQRKSGKKFAVKGILDRRGTWKTTPLFAPKRAADTILRAERAMAALGEGKPFILVYYGTDGSGGWQPVTRPLRTITTVDRFALVEAGKEGLEMRMLQVPELKRAMGFDKAFALDHGTRRDRVRLLGNGVCPPVMEQVVRNLIQ